VDLATLFALPELDIRVIVLDQGLRQREKSGEIPLQQMMSITGRRVSFVGGLAHPLRYPEDPALNQFSFYQSGVETILRILKESPQKVMVITTGSVRDVAAAFNRDPQLLESKVARIYVNAGNSGGGDLQWNPNLDPQAYIRLMRSGLPIYWCPSFGGKETLETLAEEQLPIQQYQVYWKFRQAELFDSLPNPLQNFFLYALGHKIPKVDEPVSYLKRPIETTLRDEQWKKTRHMWSTASLYHAAGRQLYRSQDGWALLSSQASGYELSPVYDFVAVEVEIDRNLRSTVRPSEKPRATRLFHLVQPSVYSEAMLSSLRKLLSEMPVANNF
jgi:hypothetical protein